MAIALRAFYSAVGIAVAGKDGAVRVERLRDEACAHRRALLAHAECPAHRIGGVVVVALLTYRVRGIRTDEDDEGYDRGEQRQTFHGNLHSVSARPASDRGRA